MSAVRRRDEAEPLSPTEPILRLIQSGIVDLARSRDCSEDAVTLARKLGATFAEELLRDDDRVELSADKILHYARITLDVYVTEVEKRLSQIPEEIYRINEHGGKRALDAFYELVKIARES